MTYQIFKTREEANEHLATLKHDSEKGAAFRKESADRRRREHESFERSDTDGCYTQWALSQTARLKDTEDDIADHDGYSVFSCIVDSKGRLVSTKCMGFFDKFNPNPNALRWVWKCVDPDNGNVTWCPDYKKESSFLKKGDFYKAYIVAKSYAVHTCRGEFDPRPTPMGFSGFGTDFIDVRMDRKTSGIEI